MLSRLRRELTIVKKACSISGMSCHVLTRKVNDMWQWSNLKLDINGETPEVSRHVRSNS
jgi:hypothetical protein